MIKIEEEIIKGSLSIKVDDYIYEKTSFKLIVLKEEEYYQFSFFTKTQVFHENVKKIDLKNKLEDLFIKHYKNMVLTSKEYIYNYKISKKGKLLSNKLRNLNDVNHETNHNKTKNYIINEGEVVQALVDLNVMQEDGYVVKRYYDKFKQINKFLEIIDKTIKDEKYLNIIDFGCGRSYLTFVLYHYLKNIKKINFKLTGIDLKKDVIEECNKIKEKYNYDNLEFYCGDISSFKVKENVDMIVVLHACDTATDYALFHAINLKVKYIFSSPCCQHEINKQLSKNHFSIINKHNILKERFSALLTDSIRGSILEYFGYKTNIIEFIELEHSAKNVLIKAVLTNNKNINSKEEVVRILKEYNIKQTLYTLLFDKNE